MLKISKEIITAIQNNALTLVTLRLDCKGISQELLSEFLEALKGNNSIKALTLLNLPKGQVEAAVNAIKAHQSLIFFDGTYLENNKPQEIKLTIDIQQHLNSHAESSKEHAKQESTSLKNSWGGNQNLYQQFTQVSVDAATAYIKQQKKITAQNMYEFLATRRRDIAYFLKHKDKENIGVIRDPKNDLDEDGEQKQYTTDLDPKGIYRDFFDTLKNELDNLIKQKSGRGFLHNPFFDRENKMIADGIAIIENGINLTKLYVAPQDSKKKWIRIDHTMSAQVDKIYQKIEPIFQSIIQANESNQKVLDNIARIAWYFAHAMPCKRGSAATTEMLVRTLLQYTGFPKLNYQNKNHANITLDLEALFEPNVENFVKKFTNFYPYLLCAVSNNDVALAKKLLQSGADPTQYDSSEFSLITLSNDLQMSMLLQSAISEYSLIKKYKPEEDYKYHLSKTISISERKAETVNLIMQHLRIDEHKANNLFEDANKNWLAKMDLNSIRMQSAHELTQKILADIYSLDKKVTWPTGTKFTLEDGRKIVIPRVAGKMLTFYREHPQQPEQFIAYCITAAHEAPPNNATWFKRYDESKSFYDWVSKIQQPLKQPQKKLSFEKKS